MSPQLLRLLSVATLYGVLVMVFQWGWGISILGSEETGIIEAWLPLFLFGILFGLFMGYHMLLLNRNKEFHDHGASNEESVSQSIKITAGQITSAAATMGGAHLLQAAYYRCNSSVLVLARGID